MNQVTPLRSRRVLDDALSGIDDFRGPHISIRSGFFRIVDAAGEKVLKERHLDVVIVDANANTSKLFFGGEKYDPNSSAPPVCFSDNGTGPSSRSLHPQAPTCTICPWNKIGSAQSLFTGAGIKACQDRKKLACILDGQDSVVVYELGLAPMSRKALKEYGKWIREQQGPEADLADIVTRIEFDAEQTGVLKFSAWALADDEATKKRIEHIVTNNLSDEAVGRGDVACDPATVHALASAGHSSAGALRAPVAPQMPPRQQLPPPAAAPAAPPAPLPSGNGTAGAPTPRRGRPPKAAAAAETNVAPFMAPAAAPGPQTLPEQGDGLEVPDFLKRPGSAPGPIPTQPRFGMQRGPAPPPEVGDAIDKAMNLPSRR